MTTERRALGAVLAIALAGMVATSCATLIGARGGLPDDTVASFPAPVRSSYELFAYKCSRCHSLSRPLSAQVSDFAHWQAYVARMRRQPGSGISENDGEQILVFLKYYQENRARILDGTPPEASSETKGGQP